MTDGEGGGGEKPRVSLALSRKLPPPTDEAQLSGGSVEVSPGDEIGERRAGIEALSGAPGDGSGDARGQSVHGPLAGGSGDYAVLMNERALCVELLHAGADTYLKSHSGRDALGLAARRDNSEMIALITEHRASSERASSR